jgi:hypothetical protein
LGTRAGSATRRRSFAAAIPAVSIVGEDLGRNRADAPASWCGATVFTRLRDDEEMPLICPTCQVASPNDGSRLLLCMGLF